MENKLEIFKNEEFGVIRTVEENGKVLFCGSDVAKALGYAKPNNAIKTHCKSITLKQGIGVITGTKTDGTEAIQKIKMTFINEGDVYRLITHSKLPSAEKFESWVFDEVLPSLRKTGGYIVGENQMNEDELVAAAMNVLSKKIERLQIENTQKQQIIGELKPKADYTDRILQSKSLVTITAISKDYGMSGQEMNKKLHELGIQYNLGGQWLLYAKYQDKGYTHSETIDLNHKDGSEFVKMNTKWTQKGRLFLYEILKNNGLLPMIERKN